MTGKPSSPSWWNLAGRKMEIVVDSSSLSITLKSSFASLIIRKALEVSGSWYVDWNITHIRDLASGVAGRVRMTSEELEAAFGNREYVPAGSKWLANRFKVSAAVEGLFIRLGPWLNIPSPGTGYDGDPNISILVTEEIREAVLGMIRAWRTTPSEVP